MEAEPKIVQMFVKLDKGYIDVDCYLEATTARVASLKIFRWIDIGGVDNIEVGATSGPTSVVREVVDCERVALTLQAALNFVLERDEGAKLLLRTAHCDN